jgi:hypothetical protein
LDQLVSDKYGDRAMPILSTILSNKIMMDLFNYITTVPSIVEMGQIYMENTRGFLISFMQLSNFYGRLKISYIDDYSFDDSSMSFYERKLYRECIEIKGKSSHRYATIGLLILGICNRYINEGLLLPDNKLISEVGDSIRSMELCFFDDEHGPYSDEDPDNEKVLIEEDYLAFVLNTCTSLK